jgi:hypothetical protein
MRSYADTAVVADVDLDSDPGPGEVHDAKHHIAESCEDAYDDLVDQQGSAPSRCAVSAATSALRVY